MMCESVKEILAPPPYRAETAFLPAGRSGPRVQALGPEAVDAQKRDGPSVSAPGDGWSPGARVRSVCSYHLTP